MAELAAVVRQLHRLISPDAQPEPAFRERLTHRLNREWVALHQRRVSPWRSNRMVQLAAVAAVVAVVLLAIVLVSTTGDDNAVEGTAAGSTTSVAVIVAAIVGIGLVIVWLSRRRSL